MYSAKFVRKSNAKNKSSLCARARKGEPFKRVQHVLERSGLQLRDMNDNRPDVTLSATFSIKALELARLTSHDLRTRHVWNGHTQVWFRRLRKSRTWFWSILFMSRWQHEHNSPYPVRLRRDYTATHRWARREEILFYCTSHSYMDQIRFAFMGNWIPCSGTPLYALVKFTRW